MRSPVGEDKRQELALPEGSTVPVPENDNDKILLFLDGICFHYNIFYHCK